MVKVLPTVKKVLKGLGERLNQPVNNSMNKVVQTTLKPTLLRPISDQKRRVITNDHKGISRFFGGAFVRESRAGRPRDLFRATGHHSVLCRLWTQNEKDGCFRSVVRLHRSMFMGSAKAGGWP
ncbi:MAG: hypothetical protein CL602_01370 [Alteromonas sp.]|nr:hypothetical protein [Alteromonas sp.]